MSLRDGSLAATLSELQNRVRSDPSNARDRISLFELLAVLGAWDRAMTQLDVAGELSAGALALVQTYREALRCEVLRAEVFAGKRSPLVFGQPEQWVALVIEALRLSAEGRHGEADDLRATAFDAAQATPGTLKIEEAEAGEPGPRRFEWIADADARLGPVLEAIVNGRYYWIPYRNIRTILVEKPADLRDMVWMPAQFQWANGGEAVGLVPTRYPGTESIDDDALRLARRTEWVEAGAGSFVGQGQRILTTDGGEFALMDLRRVDLEPADVPADAGAASAEASGG